MKIDRIVVGIDGSQNSDRAAEVAADLAELSGAEIIAVHAIGLLEDLTKAGLAPAERRLEVLRQLETGWTDPLRRTGIPVRCEIRDGHPVDALLSVIDEVEADLLVVGSRGLSTFPTQLLGSTSAQVARLTPCPMVLVPDRQRVT